MKIKLYTVLSIFLVASLTISSMAQEDGGDFFEGSEADSIVVASSDTPATKAASVQTASTPTTNTAVADEGVKPVKNTCSNRSELREEARLLLRPFKYNLAKTTMITFKRHPQKMTVIVPIYSSQNHRLVFSSKGLPQVVGIKIFNAPSGDKKREEIFKSNDAEMINTFELTEDYKGSYLFIEYSIPATDMENRDYTSKGCAIFFMGYLNLPAEEGEGTIGNEEEAK